MHRLVYICYYSQPFIFLGEGSAAQVSILKKLKVKVKILQQKKRQRNAKIRSMSHLIKTLQKKMFIAKQEADILHTSFDSMQLALFKNVQKNSKRSSKGRRYSDEVKEFAVTLQYYSTKAYNNVRSILPLLHPSLIQEWSRSINCEPGFFTEAFETLKNECKGNNEKRDCCLVIDAMENECKGNNEKRDCCLVIDAMAIRKQALWNEAKKTFSGFVDYGNGIQIGPSEVLASEALTFALVGLRSHWKMPVGYFLIDKTTASVQASLVKTNLTIPH